MKKIAVLCSGGDAPGMNAAIRAVVRAAHFFELEVIGIERGFHGLLDGQHQKMGMRSVSDIIHRGGTILRTARSEEFPTPSGQKKAAENLDKLGVEGLVVIGGDGSFKGASLLTKNSDLAVMGIPATIDNDLFYTDFSIGFDTAVNTAICAINNIRDTMQSHERICVVEVMGRSLGDIALFAGVAGGAEIIVTPENPISPAEICSEITKSMERGKTSNIVLLAEGAGSAEKLSGQIERQTGHVCRFAVLGHIQRGGMPSMADRILASRLGVRAIELFSSGKKNRLLGTSCGQIIDEDIKTALAVPKRNNSDLYKLAQILGR